MPPSPYSLLRYADLPALFISHQPNVRYLTGVACSEGVVLVTPKAYLLFVDSRYKEAASVTVKGSPYVSVYDRSSMGAFMSRHRMIGIEENYITIAQEKSMKTKYKNTKFVHINGVVEHFRRNKDVSELRALHRADQITRAMMRKIPKVLLPGLREIDLAWMMHSWAHELGAEDVSFDPIVAFGSNSSRPHHHPSKRRLRKRDIILVDCGARYQGYCGDRTEMFFLGKPTIRQALALKAVQEARDTAIAKVKAGISTRAVDRCARTVLQKYGMEAAFVHALGHGVGLEIHEGVSLAQKGKEELLRTHEVITIEPGVYFPGEFGIRLEEMIVVQ